MSVSSGSPETKATKLLNDYLQSLGDESPNYEVLVQLITSENVKDFIGYEVPGRQGVTLMDYLMSSCYQELFGDYRDYSFSDFLVFLKENGLPMNKKYEKTLFDLLVWNWHSDWSFQSSRLYSKAFSKTVNRQNILKLYPKQDISVAMDEWLSSCCHERIKMGTLIIEQSEFSLNTFLTFLQKGADPNYLMLLYVTDDSKKNLRLMDYLFITTLIDGAELSKSDFLLLIKTLAEKGAKFDTQQGFDAAVQFARTRNWDVKISEDMKSERLMNEQKAEQEAKLKEQKSNLEKKEKLDKLIAEADEADLKGKTDVMGLMNKVQELIGDDLKNFADFRDQNHNRSLLDIFLLNATSPQLKQQTLAKRLFYLRFLKELIQAGFEHSENYKDIYPVLRASDSSSPAEYLELINILNGHPLTTEQLNTLDFFKPGKVAAALALQLKFRSKDVTVLDILLLDGKCNSFEVLNALEQLGFKTSVDNPEVRNIVARLQAQHDKLEQQSNLKAFTQPLTGGTAQAAKPYSGATPSADAAGDTPKDGQKPKKPS